MRVAVEPILLACCAVELASALRNPVMVDDITWVDASNAPEITVLVIAGTITQATRPLIEARLDAVAAPRVVIAFGVCASSGGPYWDSSSVHPGWIAADHFVPGCPPPSRVVWTSIIDAARRAVTRASA